MFEFKHLSRNTRPPFLAVDAHGIIRMIRICSCCLTKNCLLKWRSVYDRRSRDPRFDDTIATFKDDAFKKRYAFLYDEQLPQEKEELKKSMKVSQS